MHRRSLAALAGFLSIAALGGTLWYRRRADRNEPGLDRGQSGSTGEAARPPAFPESCRMTLDAVVPAAVEAGDPITLRGRWGRRDPYKRAVINRGSSRALDVLEWNDTEIRARVPAELSPGLYRVGVYCAPYPESATMWSSGFADLRIVEFALERSR
jgi:hypothetical protein